MPSNELQIIEQAKFTYSPLGKAFEKQTKTIGEQGRKQIDAITNQNERLAALNNKDDHKDKIFEELIKKRLDELEELTDEINQNYLTYYFKDNSFRKKRLFQ